MAKAVKSDGDRRIRGRTPVGLHPVKGFTLDGRFLFDGAMLDRCADGTKVRFYGGLPAKNAIHLYDEVSGQRWRARLVWSEGAVAGFAFKSVPEGVGAREAAKVFGRYYALAN